MYHLKLKQANNNKILSHPGTFYALGSRRRRLAFRLREKTWPAARPSGSLTATSSLTEQGTQHLSLQSSAPHSAS